MIRIKNFYSNTGCNIDRSVIAKAREKVLACFNEWIEKEDPEILSYSWGCSGNWDPYHIGVMYKEKPK